MEEIDGSPNPTEVGTKIRDDAAAFVQKEYDSGRITTWADCHKLIEEHEDLGDSCVEGMEAFGISTEDTDGEDGDSDGDGAPSQGLRWRGGFP